MKRILAVCFVLLATGAMAHAQSKSARIFHLEGDFIFATDDQKEGQPVCTERWRFSADGRVTIFSGREIVSGRFRIENGEHSLLIEEELTTNGEPDCMGRQYKIVRNRPISMYRTAIGTIRTCDVLEAVLQHEGQQIHPMQCYGKIVRTENAKDD